MILNLISDDNFLSFALSIIIREIGNFKLFVTSTTSIPFGVGESKREIIYLVDGRNFRHNINSWLVNDDNHHVAFLSFSDIQSERLKILGHVFDLSGSVKMAKRTINNIVLSTLSGQNNEVFGYQKLTKREKEVYLLLRKEWPIYKIANHFNCSPKTIYAHRSNISKKKAARRFYNLHNEIDIKFD